MIDELTYEDTNKVLDYRLTDIERKLDTILEQLDLSLKSNARLRADLPEIITEIIKAALNKRAIEGYSRINY